MKPRSSTDEHAAIEPFRAVVAVGNAAIGGVVIVTIGTIRGDPDIDADLSLCFGSSRHKEDPATAVNARNLNPLMNSPQSRKGSLLPAPTFLTVAMEIILV